MMKEIINKRIRWNDVNVKSMVEGVHKKHWDITQSKVRFYRIALKMYLISSVNKKTFFSKIDALINFLPFKCPF